MTGYGPPDGRVFQGVQPNTCKTTMAANKYGYITDDPTLIHMNGAGQSITEWASGAVWPGASPVLPRL